MVIALAFFKRTFTRSLPMNQTHGLIIAEFYGTCCVSTNTTFAQPRLLRLRRERARGSRHLRRRLFGAEIRSDRQNFLPLWGRPLASGYNRDRGRSSGNVSPQ